MKSLRSKNENLKIWKWKAKEPTSELTKDQKMKTLWSENEILEKQNEKLKIRKWNPRNRKWKRDDPKMKT